VAAKFREWRAQSLLTEQGPFDMDHNFYRNAKLVVCSITLIFMAIFSTNGLVQAQTPDPSARAQVLKLLKSIEDNQYATFIDDGSDYFKSRISEQHFANVSQRLGQQLKNGFDLIYLTQFKQAGLVGTLWKIEYRDGSDDALAKIFNEDGKIAGFWFQ
jgi:hypothetical protein